MLEGLAANQLIAGIEGVGGSTCTSSAAHAVPPELVALRVYVVLDAGVTLMLPAVFTMPTAGSIRML
jgi:hypothetical protein